MTQKPYRIWFFGPNASKYKSFNPVQELKKIPLELLGMVYKVLQDVFQNSFKGFWIVDNITFRIPLKGLAGSPEQDYS